MGINGCNSAATWEDGVVVRLPPYDDDENDSEPPPPAPPETADSISKGTWESNEKAMDKGIVVAVVVLLWILLLWLWLWLWW